MRTEQILAAIETAVTGLTSTGSNVQREQAYDIESTSLPALIVYEAEDINESESSQAFINWSLNVDIDIHTRGDLSEAVTAINTIRGEVHAALMADYTLGLAFVQYIKAESTSRPTASIEGDRPIIKQRITYAVKYRTNWASLT